MANTSTGNASIDKELTALRDDLSALKEDLAGLAASVGGVAAAGGRAAYDRVKDQAAKTRDQATRAAAAVGEEIEARPLTSVAIAFGAGFLLGKLLERR
ncbi:MAG TPA: hypothetical protein VMV26_15450 [Alphaproteobacteria bacterium]|jgi:ElaB/YqjD/DUF883 family membrane-anchored ribosome-binding protein|nr:hypothetical protein [Alphaproteobacteria bacterium]